MNNFYRIQKARTSRLIGYVVNNGFLLAVLISLLIILVGLFIGWENNKIVPINPDTLARYTAEPHNPLRYIANWDAPIYLKIAKNGYVNSNQTAFFPLYPFFIHLINSFINSPLYSALAISWTSLVGAIFFYLKIIKRLFKVSNNQDALKAVLLFILYPTAIFLITPYTEALFSCLSLGAIYFALEKKYLTSSLLVLLATATHIDGIFVLILIALISFEQKLAKLKIFTGAFIGSLGLIAYMIFLYVNNHNPFEFISAQRTNGWLHSGYLHHIVSTFNVLDFIPLILLICSIVYWWNRRKSFSIFSLFYLIIPFIGGQFEGFSRYSLMAFPVGFMLYIKFRDNKVVYPVLVSVFAIFWTFFMLRYAGGYTGG
jgi:Gpi18-like mannosyltransferase